MSDDDVRDIAKTDVVFLGAGFSRAATDGASPLMSDFFAYLDRRKHWDLWAFLELLGVDPRQANVEEALHHLDQLSTSPLEGVEPFFDECRRRHPQIRKELDEYTIQRLGHQKIPQGNWAAQVFSRASDSTTVVTTNYDTLADRILSNRKGLRHHVRNTNCHHCKLCGILNEECMSSGRMSCDSVWRGSLLKLHGSISWGRCTNPECASQACLLPDKHCRPFTNSECECCGTACSPVLVPPTMSKTFDQFRGLKQMWNSAYLALANAKDVIFWGFSFPHSDVLVKQMMRNAFATNEKLKSIGIIDLVPEKPAAILQDLLPDRDDIYISIYEVPTDGSKPEWLTTSDCESAP